MSAPRILCSICVPTYRRPELLPRLLHSLDQLLIPEGVGIEIIVVDNDIEGTAAAVVDRFRRRTEWRVVYLIQGIKNISLARNLAIARAAGDYVLMIDDDEEASPDLLARLLATAQKFDADGVFGRVVPRFHTSTSDWVRRGSFFQRPFADIRTGQATDTTWAGNCLIRREVLERIEGPFDPSFGLTGGEDSHLFNRLAADGAVFVYDRNALASEYVPPERTTARYILRRRLRTGSTYSLRALEAGSGPRWAQKLRIAARSLVIAAGASAVALLTLPSKRLSMQWAALAASNIGHLMAVLGRTHSEYS